MIFTRSPDDFGHNLRNLGHSTTGQTRIFHDPENLTLRSYVDFHHACGMPAVLAPGAQQAWVPNAAHELCRVPLRCKEPPDAFMRRSVLEQDRIWAGSFLTEPTPKFPANCFEYVCHESDYHLDNLAKNTRRDIRRGLRNFEVSICTWQELASMGIQAQNDTMLRHGYRPYSKKQYLAMIRPFLHSPFHQIWGAWRGSDLSAWQIVVSLENHAIIKMCRSMTSHLKWCPNNALLYTSIGQLWENKNVKYISYGLSSIQPHTDELAMHRYKTRMGFDAIPCHRTFFLRRPFKHLLAVGHYSGFWSLTGKILPRSEPLRKILGLSQFLTRDPGCSPAWISQLLAEPRAN